MRNGKIAQALVWEQWRISRVELTLRLAFVLAGLVVLSAGRRYVDEQAITVLRGVLLFIVGIAALFTATWSGDFDNRCFGFPYRLGFSRPVATRWLVLVPVVYAVGWSQIFFFGSAVAIHWLAGIRIPLAGPAAMIGATVCLMIAATWTPSRLDGRIVGMVVAVGALLGWLAVRDQLISDPDPVLLSIGKDRYFALTWSEYFGLASVAWLSIAWTVHSVDRQRHGEPILPRIIAFRPGKLSGTHPLDRSQPGEQPGKVGQRASGRPARAFDNAATAQVWYEARRSAPLTLAGCVVLPSLFFAGLCVNLQWEYAPRAWLIAVVAVPIVLQFLASDSAVGLTHTQGVMRLSLFDATRPMRCDQLIALKLLVVFGWSILGTLCVMTLAGLFVLLSGEYQFWQQTFQSLAAVVGNFRPGWWYVGGLNLVFGFLASTAMLLAGGLWIARYPKVLFFISCWVLVHCGIFAWDAGHGWQWSWLWKAYGYGFPPLTLLGCLWAMAAAVRGGHLSRRYLAGTIIAWLVYLGTILWLVAAAVPPVPIPPMAYWICGGLLFVPLASAVCAPLALAAHRHG